MTALFSWLLSFAVSRLPLTSPAFYVNAISALAVALYVTGLWHLAPNVAANFFAVVVCLNLAFDLLGHWLEQAIKGID